MPTFAYTGRGTRGVINGEIDAPDRTTAVGELRNRAILVTKIAEKAGGKTVAKLGGKVSDKEMAIFTRQFSTMVDAGLPLVQCLNILAEQSESKTLRGVTANVARQVEAILKFRAAHGPIQDPPPSPPDLRRPLHQPRPGR